MTQKNKNSFLNNKSKAQHVLELTLVMPLLIICFCFVFQMMVETYAKYKFSYAFTNAARQLLKNRPIYDSLDAMGLDAGSGENVGEYDYVGVLSDHLLSEVGNIPFTDIQIIPIEGEQTIYLIGAYQLVEQMIFGQTGSEYFYFFVPVNKVYTRPLVLNYSENDVSSYFDFYFSTFSKRYYEQAGEEAAAEDAAQEEGDGSTTEGDGTTTEGGDGSGETTEGDGSTTEGSDEGGSTTEGDGGTTTEGGDSGLGGAAVVGGGGTSDGGTSGGAI